MTYSLLIGDNITRNTGGATPENITAKMRHWRDVTKDFGGYWSGGGTYWTGENDPLVSREEAIRFFITRLGSHIVRRQVDNTRWEGRITRMTLTLDGDTSVLDLSKVVNRLQLVYTKYPQGALYDGSAELSAPQDQAGNPANRVYAEYGGVTTWRNARHSPLDSWTAKANYPFPLVTRVVTNVTHGIWALKVDQSTCFYEEAQWNGGVVFFSNITASPGADYEVTADVYVESGNFPFVNLSVTDATHEQKSWNAANATGKLFQVKKRFTARDDAGGAMQAVIMGEANYSIGQYPTQIVYYVDNVTLRPLGVRKETAWQSDADSIAEWGTQEEQVVVGGMTDEEALDRQDQILAALAWPRRYADPQAMGSDNSLTIECEGYVTSLRNQSTISGGVKTCTQHLTDVLSYADLVTAGVLETNSATMFIDDENCARLWDTVQNVLDRGGASGSRWVGGVYAGRQFNYSQRDSTVKYKKRGKRILNLDNSEADYEAMQHGIVFQEGWPHVETIRTAIEDDPRYTYVSAWEFDGDTGIARAIETRELLE